MSSDPNEREKVLDILTNYGLEMEDLAVLADMPEELLTAETIPHLLKQIRKHRDMPEPTSPPPTRCAPCGRDPPPPQPIAEPPAKKLKSDELLQGISEDGNALSSLSVAAAPHNMLPALHRMLPSHSAPATHHKQPVHSTAALHHAMPVHSMHSVPVSQPTLPAHSDAVSHPTLLLHSVAVSHPTPPQHATTASHQIPPLHPLPHHTLPACPSPAPHHTLLHSSTELPHILPAHSAAVLHRALPVYSAPATHHALPTFFTETSHFTLPTYSAATSHHSLSACPTPAPHHTPPLHSSAELNHILPAHSAAASNPTLPKYSSTVSHHTIPTYSIATSHHTLTACTASASHHTFPTYSSAASNHMHPTYSSTASPHMLSTHSSASSQNTLTARPAPAPGPLHGSQDTPQIPPTTKGSTPWSSPADVQPPAGSPPEVAGISFTISRPKFPTTAGPPTSAPPPGFLSDYQGGAPDEYPYTCGLCSYQAVNKAKWLAHLNDIRHVKGKIALLKRYPYWGFNELKNPGVKPTPMHREEQRMHVRPLEMLPSRRSTSESSSSSANDRSSQRMNSQHDDRRKESANAKLLAGSSDLRSKKNRDTYHGLSSTALSVRKRQKSSEEEDSYRTNRRKEETRRRRRRESSSEEEDRYRRRDDGSSRRRRRRAESSERGNNRVDRFGRDIRRKDGSKEGSAKRRRSREEEDKHGRKTEERRAREEGDKNRRNSGVNQDGEKNTPVQLVANTSSEFNKKSLEGESGNKKEQEGSSNARGKGSNHSGDIAKKKEIGEPKEAQKRQEGQEKAVLEKGVTRMSADTKKNKDDRQPFSPEMRPAVPSKELHGARAQEEQVPSVNAGRSGSAAREKVNEETKGEEEGGEKPVPPEEPSANSNVDLSQATTPARQQVWRNKDPVKNMLDSSNCSRAEEEEEEEEEKEVEVKKQEHKMADSKTPDPGNTVIPRHDWQTGSHLGSVSAAEPPASGSESQSETPEKPGRRGRRRKASAAPAVDQVPRTTRRSPRIHSLPPSEPHLQPNPRGPLPEEKPTEREGSGGREAKKHPSLSVGVGNLPKKTSEEQKLVQKSSDAETVDQAKNGDGDVEDPDSVVLTKASVIETTEEQGTVRGPVTRGQGRRCPPPRRSKKPATRRTRVGTFTSSEDPSDHNTTDTQTHEEACHEAGDDQEEAIESLVLKEALPDTPDPSSTANIAQKDSTEAAPTKKTKTEPTLEKHPGSEAGRNSAAHKVIHGSSAAADMGQAQPPQTIGEIGSLDNRREVPHEENKDLEKEKEKEREQVEDGNETETCDLVKPAAEEEEVKINAEPVENSPEPHGKVHESEEEVVEPGAEPPQLGKELKPPEPAKEVPEPKVKFRQSESVLVVELGEEVLKPKRVLESKKSVMELGTEPQQPGEEPPQPGEEPPQPGEEPPQPGKAELKIEEGAGFAERGPDLEELDDPVGTEFIHPVTGFYCSLCQVIYVREEEAKEGHCRSPSHRRMVQAHAGSKI